MEKERLIQRIQDFQRALIKLKRDQGDGSVRHEAH